MKKILLALALTLVSASFANAAHADLFSDFACKKSSDFGTPEVTVSKTGSIYFVSVVGFRVDYSATYSAVTHGAGAGYVTVLTKVSDSSTWKNMPQKLAWKYVSDSNLYSLKGLEHIFFDPIQFSESVNCSAESF